jgi:2-dehydropantoate 2-reductase
VQENQWPRIAVMGAGAVGCYFGGMLARAGAPVCLIGRASHVEAMSRDGLRLSSLHGQYQIPISASTSASAAEAANLVLLCVKTLDTEEAVWSLAPHLAPGAVLASLQNGVDNAERIRSAGGIKAISAVVYVAAEMIAPGHVRHTGRGDLIVGDLWGKGGGEDLHQGELKKLAALFTRAGVPCQISENIEADLWTKLIMNCAYNAISALSRARYGRIVSNPGTRDVMRRVVEEAVAVAQAAGVRFPDVDLVEAVIKLGEAMAQASSSTAQDIARGKRTEIDSLNGYVARRGADLAVAAPVNQTLHALVKLLEVAV